MSRLCADWVEVKLVLDAELAARSARVVAAADDGPVAADDSAFEASVSAVHGSACGSSPVLCAVVSVSVSTVSAVPGNAPPLVAGGRECKVSSCRRTLSMSGPAGLGVQTHESIRTREGHRFTASGAKKALSRKMNSVGESKLVRKIPNLH